MKAIDFRRSFRYLAVLCAVVCGIAAAARGATNKTNPVTGATEEYTNTFTGDTAEWNESTNWDTASVPFISGGGYAPALVEGKTVSTSTAIDGWTLRVGAYNGANITWSGGITKIQAGSVGCWLTADKTSKITIASFGGNQLEGSSSAPFKLSSASVGGITWSSGLTSSSDTTLPFWYYLKGEGTVVYEGDITVANAQIIKQADITLSGNEKSIKSKTLVTFGSGTTKTFGADATIKRFNSSGDDLDKDTVLVKITSGETTLTTDSDVGACELVKTATGIDLYWVDGDPADIAEKTYKPSISVNFTAGTSLSTTGDVGIGDYALPGTSWNNLIGNNGSLTTVTGVDSAGVATTISGAKVTISGTRGYWTRDGLSAANELRQAYIDDNANNASPTVVIEGIPYYSYRVVIICSSDSNGTKLGYMTVNGVNYKGDLENATTVVSDGGSDIWGSASDATWTEGGNYLVTPEIANSDGTLTVVSHRLSGSRAGLAAIQIIEIKPDVSEDDLIINVAGDTTYTVSETKSYDTVHLFGSGTLTLDGTGKISANTAIDIAGPVVANANADRLDAPKYIGVGTVAYDGVVPPTDKGWIDEAWSGTVWLKNKAYTNLNPNTYGNANSTVRLTGISGYFPKAQLEVVPAIELVDDGTTVALNLNNGFSYNPDSAFSYAKINKLKGDGTLSGSGSAPTVLVQVIDASEFTGTLNMTNKAVYFGDIPEASGYPITQGTISVTNDVSVTVASGKTWTAAKGFLINGTLNVDGTLASSATTDAVMGSGTVVFDGKAPSPTGDAWWKNSAWQGTVEIRNHTFGNFHLATYGNSGSKVCLNGVSGYLYSTGSSGNHDIKELIIGSGGFTQNGSYSKNNEFNLPCKLSGSGTYTLAATGTGQKTLFISGDASEFAGLIAFGGANNRVVIGSSTEREFAHSSITVGKGGVLNIPSGMTYGYDAPFYIDEGGQVTNNGFLWASGGINVDGELKSTSLDNFGGGTNIVTGDTGVFALTNTSNQDDFNNNVDYARVQGTGTLRFDGTAWRTISTNNFPSTMILENNLNEGLLHRVPGLEITIGSLAGNGTVRSDWDGSTGDRNLRVVQARNTTWSGVFHTAHPHRIGNLIVASGESAGGILTLSGNQVSAGTCGLTVESGAGVNITGIWYGNATVAGALGGSGTLNGSLTFSEGATLKAYDGNENGLVVTGSVVFPETGTVAVDMSGVSPGATRIGLINNASVDASKFAMEANSGYKVTVVGESDMVLFPDIVEITVEDKEGALATVSVDNVIVMPHGDEGTTYSVPLGSTVKVVYESLAGEFLKEYTLENAEAGSVVQFQQMLSMLSMASLLSPSPGHGTSDEQEPCYAAIIGGIYYDTFAEAVEAYKEGYTIILLDNAEYPFAAGVSLVINLNNFKFTPQVADEENETVLVAVDEKSGLATFTFAFRALSDEFTVKAASDADAADVAALVVVATPSDEVAAVVSAEEYDSYFLKTATKTKTDSALKTGGTTQECDRSVSTALDSTKVLPTDEEKTAEMLNAVIALATGASEKATIPTKAGLYYWLAATAALGGEYIDGDAVLGNGSEMELEKPELPENTTKAFYKVRVAPLPPAK